MGIILGTMFALRKNSNVSEIRLESVSIAIITFLNRWKTALTFSVIKNNPQLWPFVIVGSALLVFIWSNSVAPLKDFHVLLYEGYVTSTFITGEPLNDYQLVAAPVPNSLMQTLAALISLVVSVNLTGKLILTLAVAVYTVAGYLYVARGSESKPIWTSGIILLLPSYFFFGGKLTLY
jgi:hypothetical protein